MTTPSLRLASLLAAFALPLSAQTVTTTLLNDTFTDLDRTNQSLPDSARWFTSASNSVANIDVSSGALVTKNGITTLGYFADSDSPVSLAVGESLTLSFTISFSDITDAPGNFRVGLYNSGGHRFTTDNFGNSHAAFTGGYAGYMGVVNVGSAGSNAFRVYERGGSTSLIASSLNNFAQVGGSEGGAAKTFVANNTYTATIVFSRTEESVMTISQTYAGLFAGGDTPSVTTASISDTSGLTTIFDAVAFFYNNTATLTLDNIRIDYTQLAPSIPEPASAAALFGAFALSAGALRRRRRA
jgi:PEP-CTERM putative exosortase interaction domain